MPVTKVVSIDGELGSGILDINGQEIFEGDVVIDEYDQNSQVLFSDGSLVIFDDSFFGYDGDLEVVGHVDG